MFLIGFFWGVVIGSLVTQLIIYVAVRRHRAKVGTPSTSHNKQSTPLHSCSECQDTSCSDHGKTDRRCCFEG